MLKFNELTDEQKRKVKKFNDFYTDNVKNTFTSIFSEKKEEARKESFYHNYEEIIKKVAKLMKELGVNDALTATVVIQYLIWNGYLSIDKNLLYSPSDRINNFGVLGADIMRGKSVCLNNASLQADILTKMGIDAHLIGCNVSTNTISNFGYRPNIERHVDTNVKLSYKILVKLISLTPIKRVGNHAVTLVKYKEYPFISDPTNLAFANFSDFLKAKYMGTDIEIDIKPWLMLMLGNVRKEDFQQKIYETLLFSDSNPFGDNMPKIVYDNGIFICHKNKFVLDDFYDDAHPQIEEVGKTLRKMR